MTTTGTNNTNTAVTNTAAGTGHTMTAAEAVAKYTALLLQAWSLEQEISTKKFSNPQDYADAAARVAALYDEAAACLAPVGVSIGDANAAIEAAHRTNQQTFADPISTPIIDSSGAPSTTPSTPTP